MALAAGAFTLVAALGEAVGAGVVARASLPLASLHELEPFGIFHRRSILFKQIYS